MHSALIVCERTGSWCVALRRLIRPTVAEIIETRSLAECRQTLELRPASFLVLEATDENAPALLGWLTRLEREDPLARAAVVADRRLEPWQWGAREAGALAFVASQRRLQPLADMASMFFASQTKPELGLVERVWDSLPWKKRATPTRLAATTAAAVRDEPGPTDESTTKS